MQDINGVILGVNSTSGNSQKTGRPYTRFDVQFSDGKTYTTFRPEVAGTATKLQGSAVSIRVNVYQDNFGMKYRLEEVAEEGQLPPMTENTGNGFIPQNNFQQNDNDNKRRSKEQVRWENAIIAASNLPASTSINDLVANAKLIYSEMENPPTEETTPTTTEEVAATVPGVETGADRDW